MKNYEYVAELMCIFSDHKNTKRIPRPIKKKKKTEYLSDILTWWVYEIYSISIDINVYEKHELSPGSRGTLILMSVDEETSSSCKTRKGAAVGS